MYRFLECTVEQYMTRQVKTVTRRTTLPEREALFEKHDFNAFPVLEKQAMVGLVTKFDFLNQKIIIDFILDDFVLVCFKRAGGQHRYLDLRDRSLLSAKRHCRIYLWPASD